MTHCLAFGALLFNVAFALQTPLRTDPAMSAMEEQAGVSGPGKSSQAVTTNWLRWSQQLVPPSRTTVASVCTMAVASFLLLAARYSGLFEKKAKSLATIGRSSLLDNAKVIAQLLIIYGQLISNDIVPSLSSQSMTDAHELRFTLPSNVQQLVHSVYFAGSIVTVPMLCFISGVLSQGSHSEGRIRRFIETLVVPTLIWIFFMKPVVLDTMMDPSAEGLFARLQAFFTMQSVHEEWYLQALIVWRSAAFLIFSHLPPSVAIACTCMLSCVGGYYHFEGPLSYLKLEKVLGYLPYFGIGYVFPFETAYSVAENIKLPSFVLGPIVIFWMSVIAPDIGSLPGDGSYDSGPVGFMLRDATPMDHALYWTRRLARVVLVVPAILLIIFYLIPRSKTCFTWIGPFVLYPYLFHDFAIHWRNQLLHHLMHSQSIITHSLSAQVAVHLFNLVYAPVVLVFLASRPWRVLFSWGLEPKWLGMFFKSSRDLEDSEQMSGASPDSLQATSAGSSCGPSPPEVSINRSTASAPIGFPQDEQLNTTEVFSPYDNDDDDAASVVSIPELLPSGGATYHREPWRSTGPAIPCQATCRKYYPWILPIWFIWIFLCSGSFVMMFLYVPGWRVLIMVAKIFPMPLAIVLYVSALAVPLLNYGYHYFRLYRSFEVPEMPSAPPLVHAIVVCAYKEPLDVLTRTVDSIVAQRGIGKKPIVVFASEARDPTAQSCFHHLSQKVGDAFELFLLTRHELKEGETVGKSSNENWAVQELHRLLVKEQGLDPFEVMVTVVDADSVLSSSYLAHTEAHFRRQRDGRRLVFNGPLNCYRNIGDASIFVQSYELNRCHNDLFHNPLNQYMPQSNYSLTLGLCEEIEFWTPDNMPEDIHTANKTKMNNFGGWVCVSTPALICNDLVTDFGDRYVQAKRHQFGSITEFAWVVFSLYDERKLSLQAWIASMSGELQRTGGFLDTSQTMVALVFRAFFTGFVIYHFQEFDLKFPVTRPSAARWCVLILFMPLIQVVSMWAFYIIPTFDALLHLVTKGELAYVCAPKGDNKDQKTKASKTPIADAPGSGPTAAPSPESAGQ